MKSKWDADKIKQRATRAYHKLGGSEKLRRQDAIIEFAEKHGLTYFYTIPAEGSIDPVLSGSTWAPGHVDNNIAVGTHAGYDITLVERSAEVSYPGFDTTFHRWYVLQIDLLRARELPMIFVGTKQQTKAYYAKLLTAHPNASYLHIDVPLRANAIFHSHYAVVAPPIELPRVQRLFSDEVIELIAKRHEPFAIEIEGDSISIVTEANKPSEQLLTKLLHYGLWLAKETDEKLA